MFLKNTRYEDCHTDDEDNMRHLTWRYDLDFRYQGILLNRTLVEQDPVYTECSKILYESRLGTIKVSKTGYNI